jgi:hypothetical protein
MAREVGEPIMVTAWMKKYMERHKRCCCILVRYNSSGEGGFAHVFFHPSSFAFTKAPPNIAPLGLPPTLAFRYST